MTIEICSNLVTVVILSLLPWFCCLGFLLSFHPRARIVRSVLRLSLLTSPRLRPLSHSASSSLRFLASFIGGSFRSSLTAASTRPSLSAPVVSLHLRFRFHSIRSAGRTSERRERESDAGKDGDMEAVNLSFSFRTPSIS